MSGLQTHPDAGALLKWLGPHTAGAGRSRPKPAETDCIYRARLAQIQLTELRELVVLGWQVAANAAV